MTTATHQLAYGVVTPQTRNPRAPDRITGGSSGGSAAAVAAGLVDIALGTDTGGSVRIPAACCGVAGLKTTFGLVPVEGVQPLAPSLDTVGPLARDVRTCAAAFRALAGVEPVADLGRPLRIGVVEELSSVGLERSEAQRVLSLDEDVRDVWTATLADLRADGAVMRRVALPLLPSAYAACRRVLGAEALQVHATLLAERPGPEGWEPDVRERLELARDLDPDVVASARELGARWREQLREVFGVVDVLVTPTLPCRTPRRDEPTVEVAGRPQPASAALTRLTNPWNLAGVPAGSVPAGLDGGGAPIGVQVIGPWNGDQLVLAAMAAIERSAAQRVPSLERLRLEAAPPAPRPGR
jgi:aspartyl-tRNA(Asn)/glutamyl-tRNA(Gln) amidotransferase subunit A